MKIISKYRDYYDPIAYMYGGGDPKVRYDRDQYPETKIELSEHEAPSFYQFYNTPRNIVVRYLIICDKWIPLYEDVNDMPPRNMRILDQTVPWYEAVPRWARKFWKEIPNGMVPGGDRLINLSRKIKNPIYIIDRITDRSFKRNVSTFEIFDHYVPLHGLGIQKFYPPEQLYQDLAYFVANVINESPDMQPKGKPPQTDKEKIVAHGMDLRTSFRG